MKRNFECLACHHKFEADDQMDVVCPQCSSDNVKPVSSSNGKVLLYIGTFVVALVLGFVAIKLAVPAKDVDTPRTIEDTDSYGGGGGSSFSSSNSNLDFDDASSNTEETTKTIDVEKLKIEKEAEKVKVDQPVTLAIVSPKLDDNGTYTFTAKAEHLPAGVTVKTFSLTNSSGAVVASNQTGKFQSVPASSEKGQYNLLAELSNGSVVTKDRVGGFDKVEMVDNRMQAAELTQLLNSRDRDLGLGRNAKVIKSPKIVVNSSDQNDITQIKMIDDIYGRLELGAWTSVNVTSVEYDSKRRINKFTIDIN